MDVARATDIKAKRGPAEWFTGTVWIMPVPHPAATIGFGAAWVTFEPGARTAWHTHPRGQTLYVVSGAGRLQKRGGPLQVIGPGDSVWIEPGLEHWHGAAPDSIMVHLAIQEAEDGVTVTWLDPVSDADYRGAPAP